jgi:hypothetical protein
MEAAVANEVSASVTAQKKESRVELFPFLFPRATDILSRKKSITSCILSFNALKTMLRRGCEATDTHVMHVMFNRQLKTAAEDL